MTPFEKLWAYAIKQSATLMRDGFGKWEIFGDKEQKSKIAAKAIRLNMKVNFEERMTKYGELYQSLIISY